jgi:hypothetical protein
MTLSKHENKHIDNTAELYLDLIKRCLTNTIYGDDRLGPSYVLPNFLNFITNNITRRYKLHLGSIKKYDFSLRMEGKDYPTKAHTMIGLRRLDNIQYLIKDVLNNNVAGDFIEAGVWRGGAVIFMRAVLKAYNVKDRYVWVADSFEGLPIPNTEKYPVDAKSTPYLYKIPYLAVPLDEVKANFQIYNLLDEQVRFLKGWFKDTLPKAKIKKLSLIRADGDMYESTLDILINLYPKLSKGGYVIIDDYNEMASCKQAVNDFRRTNGINDKIIPIDDVGVYWRRS